MYGTLSETEKLYWYPHTGEVDSGLIIAPGIPDPAHKALMDKLRTTHGKTWDVWDIQKATQLPLGEPSLALSIEPIQINTATKQMMKGTSIKSLEQRLGARNRVSDVFSFLGRHFHQRNPVSQWLKLFNRHSKEREKAFNF